MGPLTAALTSRQANRGTAAIAGLAVTFVVAGCGTAAIAVQAMEYRFAPETIRVAAGQPVRLVLTNAGQLEHDLVVERLPAKGVRAPGGQHGHGGEVAAHALPGRQAWVELTPTAPGTYDVSCTVPGHKDLGMRGTLIVE
jgi:uncharacterized cupredoxin-like copper-binding protein